MNEAIFTQLQKEMDQSVERAAQGSRQNPYGPRLDSSV